MEKTDCCLCHHNENVIYFTNLPDRSLKSSKKTTTLVSCTNCGLIYQNPRLTASELSLSYPDDYEAFQQLTFSGKRSWLLQKAYDYGFNKRVRFITQFKKSGRLLDIGCSTGTFLNQMRNYGDWGLEGVEISSYASEIARNQFNLHVFTGTLEQALFPDEYFDVITLWDVLEHLYDPVNTLREINRVLKKDGICVVRVPNGESLDARLFRQYWKGLDAPRHLYVFTQKTLIRSFELTGFQALLWNTSSGNYITFLQSLQFWLDDQPICQLFKSILLRILYHPIIRLLSIPFFIPASLFLFGPNMIVTIRKADKHEFSS